MVVQSTASTKPAVYDGYGLVADAWLAAERWDRGVLCRAFVAALAEEERAAAEVKRMIGLAEAVGASLQTLPSPSGQGTWCG